MMARVVYDGAKARCRTQASAKGRADKDQNAAYSRRNPI
jgi:hypothetical protein